MASTTFVSAPAGATWTLVYTAAGAVTIGLQNRHSSADMLIRIGSGAAVGDSPDAAARRMFPNEFWGPTLATGDKVFKEGVTTFFAR